MMSCVIDTKEGSYVNMTDILGAFLHAEYCEYGTREHYCGAHCEAQTDNIQKDKQRALRYPIFINEKRICTVKARECANARPQRPYTGKLGRKLSNCVT